ncbi:MAG TPA: potassium channel family protein [Dermatophilaceae bacterium]|nr:potassium channel family protein [Dermatophilaceae bacterium]
MDGELSRLDRYESRSATPMTVFAVAFLLVYSTPIIWTTAPDLVDEILAVLNISLWGAFVADLGIRAFLSGKPLGYIVRHPIDLLLILLPMLRPLRVLRVFTAMQTLIRQGGRISIGKTLAGAAGAALLLMFIAAVAMLDAERSTPESPIQTFGDAIWWSGATITTVGYGDVYPVTWVGRWVAFALMLVGISVIGVVTASIAAWFVGRGDAGEPDLVAEIRALRDEMAQLREQPSVPGTMSGRTEA